MEINEKYFSFAFSSFVVLLGFTFVEVATVVVAALVGLGLMIIFLQQIKKYADINKYSPVEAVEEMIKDTKHEIGDDFKSKVMLFENCIQQKNAGKPQTVFIHKLC